MKVQGQLKEIRETQTFGASGFRKREVVLTTNEQYPQPLLIEFVQDKCDIINNYQVGQSVEISINLRGREWTNPEGKVVYFNSIQGWRIENFQATPTNDIETTYEKVEPTAEDPNDLPFSREL